MRDSGKVQADTAHDRLDSTDGQDRDLFLSHATLNKPWVLELAGRVEAETWNGRLLTVWVDDGEIRPGHSVVGEINRGLERSRFIALVMTPAYFNSKSGWTEAEWQAAIYPDPAGREGRVIPLLVENCPRVPALLRHLGYIDFRSPDDYEYALRKLLAILRCESPRSTLAYGQRVDIGDHISPQTLVAQRGIVAGLPNSVHEVLPSNLLPVKRLPDRVWSAPIARSLGRGDRLFPTFPGKKELKDIIAKAQAEAGVEHPFMPAFRRHGDRIVTFHDLSLPDGPFATVVEMSQAHGEPAESFLQDGEKLKLLTSLLNMTIGRHAYKVGLVKDEHERFFFPPNDGKDRPISWRRGARPRVVTKRFVNADGSEGDWLHIAARLPLMHLGGRFFIRITPTWVFTRIGTADSLVSGPRLGPLINRWTGKERNRNLLYHIMFWAFVLGEGKDPIRMRAGDQHLIVDPNPASIALNEGIEDDHANLEAQLTQVPESEDEPDIDFSAAAQGEDEEDVDDGSAV